MCGKQFGKKAILTDHIRTHTKEKPFKCPYEGCTKSFAEKGNMKIHYKRHLIKKEENKCKDYKKEENKCKCRDEENSDKIENSSEKAAE